MTGSSCCGDSRRSPERRPAEAWSVKQNLESAWQAWQQFEARKSSHS